LVWAISRNYLRNDFPEELTIEHKIIIFADRVKSWQLNPAKEIIESNPNHGFIVLYAIMHYFEAIGKFIKGIVGDIKGDRKSRVLFKVGFSDVAPYLGLNLKTLPQNILDIIYDKVRSSLYHTGLTGPGIALTGDISSAIIMDGARVIINPRQLVISLVNHFDAYIEKLNNPEEITLRQHFQNRFDYLYGESMKLEM
jgi:hypothetical protein